MNDLHSEENEDLFLNMFNSIFKYFISKPINSIEKLANEFILRDALFSIEPNLSKESGIELSTDNEYGLRYGNFVSIIDSIEAYLSSHQERVTFTSLTNFKSRINISSLMKKDKRQLIIACELLIFISSISSNKEFLDLLENCNEDIISLYLSVSEKYSKKYDDTALSSPSNINNINNLKSSYYDEESNNIRHSLLGKQSTDNSNANYANQIKMNEELSRELNEKSNELLLLQKTYNDLDAKYKDCLIQLHNIQNSTINDNTLLQEDLLNEKTNNMQLTNQIHELEMLNENIKRDNDEKIKTLNFKLTIMNNKAIANEEKIESLKVLTGENKKLKAKLKNLSANSENEAALADMSKNIEAKTRFIETLGKDKDSLNEKIAQLQKDLAEHKDIIRKNKEEREQLENYADELKRENKRLDMIMKSNESSSMSTAFNYNRSSSITGRGSGLGGTGTNLAQLGQMSYENEIEDLNKKIEEKDKEIFNLKRQLKECGNELESLRSEQQIYADSKDTLYFEKEKILNDLQKEQLDKQKAEMAYENQIKQLKNEISDLKQNDSIGGSHRHKKYASVSGSLMSVSNGDGNQREIGLLKIEIAKKNDLIQALQNKINSNDNETSAFFSQFQDLNGDGNNTIKDIEEYKHSYDGLKQRVNKEYELISSSFYELAIQFMNLKSEVNNNKNKNSNQNKTWLELERSKNFP